MSVVSEELQDDIDNYSNDVFENDDAGGLYG